MGRGGEGKLGSVGHGVRRAEGVPVGHVNKEQSHAVYPEWHAHSNEVPSHVPDAVSMLPAQAMFTELTWEGE